jgi:hypothetical protein
MDSYLTKVGIQAEGRGKHVDDSFLNPDFRKVRRLVWIREPGARTASNAKFWLDQPFAKRLAPAAVNGQWNMSRILRSAGCRKVFNPAIGDGWSGTSWISGLSPGVYVKIKPDNKKEKERRELMLADKVSGVIKAILKLEQTLWFGVQERKADSVELFKWQMSIEKPIPFPSSNVGKRKMSSFASDKDLHTLRTRIHPMDTVLYDYAEALFDLRFKTYKKQKDLKMCMPRLYTSEPDLREYVIRKLHSVWDMTPWPAPIKKPKPDGKGFYWGTP